MDCDVDVGLVYSEGMSVGNWSEAMAAAVTAVAAQAKPLGSEIMDNALSRLKVSCGMECIVRLC